MTKIILTKKQFKPLYDISCNEWKSKFQQKFFFSDDLEFEESFILEMEKACTNEQLPVFKNLFKDYYKNKIDVFSISTYSDLCKALGENEITEKNFVKLPDSINIKKLVAQARVQQLERWFNKGWTPNFDNQNEYKWFPYFEKKGLGWVFLCSGYFCYASYAWAGIFESKEISDYVGKTFLKEIYIDIIS